MDHLQRKAYAIIGSQALLRFLAQNNPHQVSGKMSWYDAPAGFIPGKDDDINQGYGIGSEIFTKDKAPAMFKCIDPGRGKARWMRILAVPAHIDASVNIDLLDEDIPDQEELDAQEKEKADIIAKSDANAEKAEADGAEKAAIIAEADNIAEQANELSEEEKEHLALNKKKAETLEAASNSIPKEAPNFSLSGPEFEDLPFRGYITKKINSIYELVAVVEKGKLADVPFMNEERANKTIEWLKESGHLEVE